jgi:hypothetical protein
MGQPHVHYNEYVPSLDLGSNLNSYGLSTIDMLMWPTFKNALHLFILLIMGYELNPCLLHGYMLILGLDLDLDSHTVCSLSKSYAISIEIILSCWVNTRVWTVHELMSVYFQGKYENSIRNPLCYIDLNPGHMKDLF